MNIEDRIKRLEDCVGRAHISGTILSRVIMYNGSIQWSLGLGPTGMPKIYFIAETIKKVIELAEKELDLS